MGPWPRRRDRERQRNEGRGRHRRHDAERNAAKLSSAPAETLIEHRGQDDVDEGHRRDGPRQRHATTARRPVARREHAGQQGETQRKERERRRRRHRYEAWRGREKERPAGSPSGQYHDAVQRDQPCRGDRGPGAHSIGAGRAHMFTIKESHGRCKVTSHNVLRVGRHLLGRFCGAV